MDKKQFWHLIDSTRPAPNPAQRVNLYQHAQNLAHTRLLISPP